MTREEFESILEEAFLEGYNDAMEEIFEEDSSFDLEEEMDSYNEESGHHRNYERKFPLGGFKHARTKDLGKRFAKEAVKQGVHMYDPNRAAKEVNEDPKKAEVIKNIIAKSEKDPKAIKAGKYIKKNANMLEKDAKEKFERFKQGKLKDLKLKLSFNALRNLQRANEQ